MNFKKGLLMAAFGALVSLTGVASASANVWQDNHPRRVEVNHRLAHQHYRINRDLREGKISFREAANLHREDRMMRREERFDARFNGGHITKPEQRALNQQENGVSRQIYNEAH
jgi:hypothetical protein